MSGAAPLLRCRAVAARDPGDSAQAGGRAYWHPGGDGGIYTRASGLARAAQQPTVLRSDAAGCILIPDPPGACWLIGSFLPHCAVAAPVGYSNQEGSKAGSISFQGL
jgi:hypothetical protein